MSTKTTFKRVALVAVAALGLGVLTSVAPANAGAVTPTALSAGTPSPARVGAASVTTITVTHPTDTAPAFTAAVKVTTAPATSKAATDTNTATLGATIVVASPVAGSNSYAVGGANMAITHSPAATTTSTSFKVSFVADVAGTYTLLVSTGAASYAAGNASTVVTITTAGAPTAMKVASIAGAVVEGGNTSTGGQLIGVTLTDANGNATVLTDFEGINVTTLDTTVGISNPALAKGEDTAGTYIIRLTDGGTVATGSAVISFSGTGLLPSTLTTNMSATKIGATASTAEIVNCTTAANCSGVTANTTTAALAATVSGATSLTITGVSNATAAAVYHLVAITDNNEEITYDSYITVAAGTAAVPTITTTFTAPAPAADATVLVDFGPAVATMTYQKPAAKTLSVADSVNSVLSATAGTNKFTAKVVDQYGTAVANHSVSVSVSGRNTVASKTLGLTDANGLVSFSLTDAGTTGTRDTVTFTATVSAGGTGSALAYVNYGTVTVDSVTVSGGSKAETIAGSTLTAIKAGDNGPEGSAVAIKAVVKDASGNLLAGVPVVFTVDAGAIKKTASIDYATVYTGSDGSASTSVFNWISGKQTITATAGGKSSTDYLTWAANDATSARVLTATATGDIVSLKVVDRFGNAVAGVTINLSRTGAGLFGNGASTQNIDTDKNGTADVRFIGSGTVVAELAATYAQAYAAAGNITTKAATAATAGTTAGTGATLTPAGVAKVSVVIAEGADPVAVSSQAAADAAAEATDAANAATDAANAAAEAADAATAAAQDAADAVAALSTQVSEMVNALKKQITALTNLVIKIQKKVKA
jgi:hypothetical protein